MEKEFNCQIPLEALSKMDGQPVWIEELEQYGLVSVMNYGQWKGIPFVVFVDNGVRFEWDIEERGLHLLAHSPTAEFAPVVHARWETRMIDGKEKACCSGCGQPNKQYKPPYCPHCGAKMDKED